MSDAIRDTRNFLFSVLLMVVFFMVLSPERAGQIAARAVKAYNAEMAQTPVTPTPPPGVRV